MKFLLKCIWGNSNIFFNLKISVKQAKSTYSIRCLHWIKMKVYRLVQQYLAFFGLHSHRKNPFNARNSITLFLLVALIFSTNIFLWHEAANFMEITVCFYAAVTSFLNGLSFVIVIFKTDLIYTFIENIESAISKSE